MYVTSATIVRAQLSVKILQMGHLYVFVLLHISYKLMECLVKVQRTHVRTHACMYAFTHACTHSRMHVRTHACMYALTHACTHSRMHVHTHTQTQRIAKVKQACHQRVTHTT